MVPLVLYHAGCWDGFCAAWVARGRLPQSTEFVPVNYGEDPPDVRGRTVYILDFSYKRPVMERLRRGASMLTVLDHHKTAREDLEGFGQSPPNEETNVRCVFDLNKSGARLTWDHFYGLSGIVAPWLVDYTEDRDLWRWKLPASREVNAALRSYPLDFAVWDSLHALPTPMDTLALEGTAILRREQQIIDQHVGHAREIDLDGHKILAVNATVLFSEIAGELAKDRPFGACWFIRADGRKVWSLRSREGGVDVAAVAKRHGGGGHFAAAGFEE